MRCLYYLRIIILFDLVFFITQGWGYDMQSTFNFIYNKNILEIKLVDSNRPSAKLAEHSTGELGLLAHGLIKGYQQLLSSQDKPSCVFTPSCSNFGSQCFAYYNPFKAVVLTSDRLQRCHGGAYPFYPFDSITNRLSDPVENYQTF